MSRTPSEGVVGTPAMAVVDCRTLFRYSTRLAPSNVAATWFQLFVTRVVVVVAVVKVDD